MIYVSTGGFKNQNFNDAVNELSNAGIVAFELTGGKHSDNSLERLTALGKKYALALHNYFPPPKIPFVLNLASFQDDIVQSTINHITNAIDLSNSIGAKFYSFHAGYLIDPLVNELGDKIINQELNDRQRALDYFIDRASSLAEYAENKGVKLLVENNVLSRINYESFDDNPLLMVEATETHEIIDRSHPNLGLLVDVAHLKISANTLSFSENEYLDRFYDNVDAYHLSDNLGLEDTNNEITISSWFWPHIRKDAEYYSVEVYNKSPKFLKTQVELIESMLI